MKKYNIKYGEHTVVLPADIIHHLAEADADELKALILIAAAGGEKGENKDDNKDNTYGFFHFCISFRIR